MNRQRTVLLAALSLAVLGCAGSGPTSGPATSDRPNPQTSSSTGRDRPTTRQTATTGKPQPAWKTVQGKGAGKHYAVQIPPGWTWDDGMADRTSVTLTSIFKVKVHKELSRDDPEEYLKKQLDQLGKFAQAQKSKVRDQRIIKVGDLDAGWLVYTTDPGDGSPPTILQTHCFLRTAGYDVILTGERLDARPNRTEADFAQSQEDFLKMSQSFRLTADKDGKEK